MQLGERLHAKRAATEKHIREMEATGTVGRRYTATMPDAPFMGLGLVSDVGWLLQLGLGTRILATGPSAAVATDLCLIVAGVGVTCWLGIRHEKEIALRWQKDASFGLVALGGLLGIVIGVTSAHVGFAAAGALNAAGSLPIYLSFHPGIVYGIR